MYDGFISYSHAADDLLAPRLQSALQRFAKPWWKRRAVRIFRDESSLSANPHLWSSITEALDSSGWLVLLLSPDAAASEWVNQEISYWVDNRDPKKILPVVTDGEFGWTGDVTGSAAPQALRGVFSEEPRWVDLRGVDTETELDLQNPEFAAAVADIASSIRGIPKDELASEEVRQHRRTVRTAWAAGVAVTVLAIAAAGASIQSARNADEAQRQAQLASDNEAEAEDQRTEAERNAAEAERQAQLADENAADAERNAALAEARELAASAIGVVGDDPQLSLLLALEAIDQTPTGIEQPVEVVNALWRAGSENRLAGVIEHGFLGETLVEVSEDGRSLLFGAEQGPVRMYEAIDLSLRWEVEPPAGLVTGWASMSPDGSRVAVPFVGDETDSENRVVVLDGHSGDVIRELPFPNCDRAKFSAYVAWSRTGDRLAVSTAIEPCPRPEVESGTWVEVYDAATWSLLELLAVDAVRSGPMGVLPRFDEGGRLFVLGTIETQIYSADTYELEETIDASFGYGDIAPDGSRVATYFPFGGEPGLAVFSVETGARIDLLVPVPAFTTIPNGLRYSPDSQQVIAGTESENTYVWDARTGDLLATLPGGTADAVWLDHSTGRAYTAHRDDGTVKVWLVDEVPFARTPLDDLGVRNSGVGVGFVASADHLAILTLPPNTDAPEYRFFGIDELELTDVALPSARARAASTGDRFVVQTEPDLLVTVDPASGNEEPFLDCREAEGSCYVRASLDSDEYAVRRYGTDSPDPEADPIDLVEFVDRSGRPTGDDAVPIGVTNLLAFGTDWLFAEAPRSGELFILDRASGDVVAEWTDGSPGIFEASPSGEYLFTESPFRLIEVGSWETRELPAVSGDPLGAAFGPDDRQLAVSTRDDSIHIYDLATDTVVQTIPIAGVADLYWLDKETLLVGTVSGAIAEVSLRLDDLLASAKNALRRGFSPQECLTYRIDPCPTLEEMRSR